MTNAIFQSLNETHPVVSVVPGSEKQNDKKSSEKSLVVGDGVDEKGSKASMNPFDDDDDDDTKNPFKESNVGKEPQAEPRSPQKSDNRQDTTGDRKVLFGAI